MVGYRWRVSGIMLESLAQCSVLPTNSPPKMSLQTHSEKSSMHQSRWLNHTTLYLQFDVVPLQTDIGIALLPLRNRVSWSSSKTQAGKAQQLFQEMPLEINADTLGTAC